jgi:hypothetical protein
MGAGIDPRNDVINPRAYNIEIISTRSKRPTSNLLGGPLRTTDMLTP